MKGDFGLRGVRERQCKGSEEILKNCHICYIKTENTRFSLVRQSRYKSRDILKLLREALSRGTVAIASV